MFLETISYKIWHYLLFLCEIAHHGKNLIAILRDFFASIEKILFGWGTGHWAVILWRLETFLTVPNFLSIRSFGNLRQVVYTMLISKKSPILSLVVKGKFGKTSKSLKILWSWLSTEFSLPFYVFINNWFGQKQSYLE